MRASLCAAALLVVFSFSLLADESTTNSVSLTVDGQTYQNVRWGRVTAETVATLPLWKLPVDLQTRFHYNPEAIAAQKQLQQKQAALVKASKVIMGNIIQVVPEGILASTYYFMSSSQSAVVPDGHGGNTYYTTPGPSQRSEGPIILATGCPKKDQRAEGEFVTFFGYQDGTWSYRDPLGVEHTVQKWVYLREPRIVNGALDE